MNFYQADNFDFLDKKTKKILIESRESFVPHTPYSYEKRMLEAVRTGNMEEAKASIRLLDTTGKAGNLSPNPLRQAQIIFISYITQITRAAMDGGVAEDLAYAMSDSYIQTAESCVHPKQLHALRDRSLRDFVNAVKHQRTSPPYSKSVRTAINYMHSHFQEKLSLEVLAASAGLSLGRFSHLFKQETGMSPMHYLQKEKIETAKTMLHYTPYSISEISAILGFSSDSHFIKVFQKYLGISPGKYRNQEEE